MLSTEEKWNRLVEPLVLLANDADTQLAMLPHFVHRPDELALIFDDCFVFLDTLVESGLVNDTDAESLRALDQHFAAMSGQENAQRWTDDAVRNAPEWAIVRESSRSILQNMGREIAQPQIDWVTFVVEE